MYLTDEQAKTPAPTISAVHIFHFGMSLLVIGLIGLIVFEAIRLTHKPTTAFNKFLAVADFSGYNKCVKNKGGDGCKKHLLQEWEQINGK